MAAWNGIFKEAATVGKREITVKRSSYNEEDATAIEIWSDTTLFKVRGLNHLRVSGFTAMTSFSPMIVQLNSLLELLLVDNGLTTLPIEIGKLTKLRVLDVSNNNLASLPDSFYNLSSLQTMLVCHNQLTADAFPPCTGEPFPNIQYLDLAGNKLAALPAFVYSSSSLLELKASHNSIETIEADIGALASLKAIEMHNNSLQELPSQLSQCSKLKSLIFDDNPISEPRLRKVLSQFGATKPKAVLDYLAASKSKGGKGGGKKKGKGGKGKRPPQSESEDEETEQDQTSALTLSKMTTIHVVKPDRFIEVKAMNNARQVRPYLVCAVVKGLQLEDDFGDNFRKFITLQTKLHDTVCRRRHAATIATHNLDTITPPIMYKAAMAHKVAFTPLEWTEKTNARKFIDFLKANKPETTAKKVAGSNPHSVDMTAAHLSKFLPMVDPSQMVYLEDSNKTVISLPPLTNSEDTKLTEKTRDVFIEITSSTSLADAKAAMDALIIEMARSGLLSNEQEKDPSLVPTPGSECTVTTPSPKVLIVQPVKVIDEANKLLVYYPSRNDLTLDEKLSTAIRILRPT